MPPADRSHHISHVLTKPRHFEEPLNLCSCRGEKTTVGTVTASTTLTSIKIWFLCGLRQWWLCGRKSQVLQVIITTPSTPPLCLVLAMQKWSVLSGTDSRKKQGTSGILVELRGCGLNKNIIYTLKRILTTKPAILNATVAVIVVTCESQASQGCSPAIRNQTFTWLCIFG